MEDKDYYEDYDDQMSTGDDGYEDEYESDDDFGLEEEEDFDSFDEEEEEDYSNEYEEEDDDHEFDDEPSKKSNWLIYLLVVVILAGGGFATYWFLLGGQEKFAQNRALSMESDVTEEDQTMDVDTAASMIQEDSALLAADNGASATDVSAVENVSETTVTPVNIGGGDGTYSEIGDRTGRSYVVIGSFFDKDQANDFAQRMANDGTNCGIIAPFGRHKFHRVVLAQGYSNYNEAFTAAEDMKATFGDGVWALKY